jgi:hypothetical protein
MLLVIAGHTSEKRPGLVSRSLAHGKRDWSNQLECRCGSSEASAQTSALRHVGVPVM